MLKTLAPYLDTEHQQEHKSLPDPRQLPCLPVAFGYALLLQWHTRRQSFKEGLFTRVQCKPEVFIVMFILINSIKQLMEWGEVGVYRSNRVCGFLNQPGVESQFLREMLLRNVRIIINLTWEDVSLLCL